MSRRIKNPNGCQRANTRKTIDCRQQKHRRIVSKSRFRESLIPLQETFQSSAVTCGIAVTHAVTISVTTDIPLTCLHASHVSGLVSGRLIWGLDKIKFIIIWTCCNFYSQANRQSITSQRKQVNQSALNCNSCSTHLFLFFSATYILIPTNQSQGESELKPIKNLLIMICAGLASTLLRFKRHPHRVWFLLLSFPCVSHHISSGVCSSPQASRSSLTNWLRRVPKLSTQNNAKLLHSTGQKAKRWVAEVEPAWRWFSWGDSWAENFPAQKRQSISWRGRESKPLKTRNRRTRSDSR